jgi:hypothetical protein
MNIFQLFSTAKKSLKKLYLSDLAFFSIHVKSIRFVNPCLQSEKG